MLPGLHDSRNIVDAVSLQAGHKLAHYEILEPIGKGGMGEVYRAKDSKVGRDVAIKVLPDTAHKPSFDKKKSSFPSRRHSGCSPPSVDI